MEIVFCKCFTVENSEALYPTLYLSSPPCSPSLTVDPYLPCPPLLYEHFAGHFYKQHSFIRDIAEDTCINFNSRRHCSGHLYKQHSLIPGDIAQDTCINSTLIPGDIAHDTCINSTL